MVQRLMLRFGRLSSSLKLGASLGRGAFRRDVPQIDVRVGDESSTFSLPTGRYEVGGSLSCDLVVPGCLDDVVCTLDLSDREPFLIVTSAVPGGAIGEEAVVAGRGYPLTGDASFASRDLSIRLSVTPRPGGRVSRLGGQPPMAMAAGLAGALVLAYALVGADFADRPPPPTIPPAVTAALTPEALLDALQRRMMEVGVASPPRIVAEIDRVVVDLPDDMKRRDVVMAVIADLRQQSAVPIVTRAVVDERMLNLIAGASFFPRKLVIGRNGQAYAEGDLIGGEWRVKDIRADGVVLDRGQEQITVAFGDIR